MTSTSTETALPTGTWQADTVHSTFGFGVAYAGVGTWRSRFNDVAATLTVADDGTAELTGTAQTASIDVADPNFKGHLLADDFFAAEQHPEITFHATDIQRTGDDVVVTGELTLRGTTKAVEGRGTVTELGEDLQGNTRLAFALEAVVDRHAFGVSWNAPLPKGGNAVGDDVTITVDLALVKA